MRRAARVWAVSLHLPVSSLLQILHPRPFVLLLVHLARIAMTPIIAVYGATGNQGGSVARSLLQNPSFRVRAITRNPSSEASRGLASLGAEVIQADGFHRDEMLAAFKGAWGAFININSDDKIWRTPGAPTEFDLGKILIDAAADASVTNLVFSSGPPCVKMTDGKVRMNAMESSSESRIALLFSLTGCGK